MTEQLSAQTAGESRATVATEVYDRAIDLEGAEDDRLDALNEVGASQDYQEGFAAGVAWAVERLRERAEELDARP